jgi:hypothetical protein
LDIVRGPSEVVASAVLAEVTRFVKAEQLSSDWVPFTSLGAVYGSVPVFTNVPTIYFVLPTSSAWTVLWNNSFLCDGYDSLCHCLTANHGLTTMHWKASDHDALFQAGTSFTFRQPLGLEVSERYVYCSSNDGRWEFGQGGEPIPEENLEPYSARRVRDRLNEAALLSLLAKLGARPRDDDFYSAGVAFRIERTSYPDSIAQRRFSEFARTRPGTGG